MMGMPRAPIRESGAPRRIRSGAACPTPSRCRLAQAARLDFEDVTVYAITLEKEGARPNHSHGFPDALIHRIEGPDGPWRTLAGVVLEPGENLVLTRVLEPTVGVADDDDLLGAEQMLRDRQRADRVVGGDPPGVSEDVGVPLVQTE